MGKTYKALEKYYQNKGQFPGALFQSTGGFRIYKIGKPTAKKILTNLRQNVVRDIVDFKYFLKIRDYLKYIDGELLKSENGRYYKIGFESRIMQSVQFDRQGNFINFIFSQKKCKACEDKTTSGHNLMDAGAIRRFEENFFNNFYGRFDIEKFKTLFEESFKLSLSRDVIFREGRITAFEGRVVYEVIFRSTVRFFLLMDGRGNYLDSAASDDLSEWERIFTDLYGSKNVLPPFSLLKNRRLLPE